MLRYPPTAVAALAAQLAAHHITEHVSTTQQRTAQLHTAEA